MMFSDVALGVLAPVECADKLAISPKFPSDHGAIADPTFSVSLESQNSFDSSNLSGAHVHSKAHLAQGVKY